MNPVRRNKLIFVGLIVFGVGVAAGLTLYALNQNINLFLSPSQVVAGEAPTGHTFRIGGMVKKQSVQRHDTKVEFVLSDYDKEVTVRYTGILPDLFREGQGIVALGKLDQSGIFQAQQVLAKHDENYMPPEVKSILKPQHNTPL